MNDVLTVVHDDSRGRHHPYGVRTNRMIGLWLLTTINGTGRPPAATTRFLDDATAPPRSLVGRRSKTATQTWRIVRAPRAHRLQRLFLWLTVLAAALAKSLVASSTQAQSPWPCYSAPPLSRTAANAPIRPG